MVEIHRQRSSSVAQAKQESDEKCPLFLLAVTDTKGLAAISFPGFSTSFPRVEVQNSRNTSLFCQWMSQLIYKEKRPLHRSGAAWSSGGTASFEDSVDIRS
jgi:hypothetical protein